VVVGNGGNSGMGGTVAALSSFAAFTEAVAPPAAEAVTELGVVAGGAVAVGVGVAVEAAGQAGAVVSAAREAPVVAESGGTPSGVWFEPLLLLVAARGATGPSLIFTYR
jgi:hypothetical protein